MKGQFQLVASVISICGLSLMALVLWQAGKNMVDADRWEAERGEGVDMGALNTC